MALVWGEFEVLQNNSFNKGVHYCGSLLSLTAAVAATDRKGRGYWQSPRKRLTNSNYQWAGQKLSCRLDLKYSVALEKSTYV